MDNTKEIRLNIRITKDEKEAFLKVCKEKGYNSSAIVRNLVNEWTANEIKTIKK